MIQVCFEAAKVAFHLRGPAIFTQPLGAIYSAFPEPGPAPLDTYEVVWHPEGLCHWRSVLTLREGNLRLHSPSFAPVVTTFLVGRLLEEAHPGLLTLHGNALLSPTTGRLLLLIGASGSGKSTLSQEVAPYGYQQVSEDLLLLGEDDGIPSLFPFPRAAALRPARPGEEGLPWIAPGGGSTEGRRKHILPVTVPSSTRPLSLAHCEVVVLQEPMQKQEPCPPDGQEQHGGGFPPALTAWLTWSDEALVAALRRAGIPIAEVRQENDLSCLRYAAPLRPEQWQHQFEILELAGAMLLSGGAAAPAGGVAEFPAEPSSKPLTAAQGVEACLPHLRRYRPLAPHAAARQFLALARAFQSGRFLSFASGGSPATAAQRLEQAISAGREPVT